MLSVFSTLYGVFSKRFLTHHVIVRCKSFVRANKSIWILGIVFFGFFIPMEGCFTLPFSGGLSLGTSINYQVDRNAWLSKVEIHDHSIEDDKLFNINTKVSIEESLTINILDYLKEVHCFKDVKLLPGKLEDKDIILRFQFDRYLEKLSFHPISLILFPLLLPPPILTDTSDLAGKLIIEDSQGLIITEVISRAQGKQTIFGGYSVHDGVVKTRTFLINDLLNKAMINIQKQES